MSNWGDHLLYAVSAKQEMAWLNFKEIFNQLFALQLNADNAIESNLIWKRSQTVRILDSLGHCDFDFSKNGGRVYAAPAALLRLPWAGLPRATLVGCRSPQLLSELNTTCGKYNFVELDITQQQQAQGLTPQRVALQAESVVELIEVAEELYIPFVFEPPAWSILHFSASLADYLAKREWTTSDELTLKRKTFDSSSLQFRYGFTPKPTETLWLSRYSHPVRNVPVYFLWQHGQRAEVEGEWGRYAVLHLLGLNILLYDKNRYIIAVPLGAPLPRLLERALVLCSGYAATYLSRDQIACKHPETWGFSLFRDVPPQVAEIVATKIEQSLVSLSLEVNL